MAQQDAAEQAAPLPDNPYSLLIAGVSQLALCVKSSYKLVAAFEQRAGMAR